MAHPHDWIAVQTRPLQRNEVFEVCDWLRGMTTGDYDVTPSPEPDMLTIYFAERSNAVFFKLAWGGSL